MTLSAEDVSSLLDGLREAATPTLPALVVLLPEPARL